MEEKSEISIRTKDGTTFGFKNVKNFSVTPYDYQIVHMDGSVRLINREGVIDLLLGPGSSDKIVDSMPPPIGTA